MQPKMIYMEHKYFTFGVFRSFVTWQMQWTDCSWL